MKKITSNETDLLKIVNKVLNEQETIQFNEDEIELLHFIFERELKPPFRKGDEDEYDLYLYYNRDGEWIGWLDSFNEFTLYHNPFGRNVKDKVCQIFGIAYDTLEWWYTINPHLKSWMKDKLSIKIKALEVTYI